MTVWALGINHHTAPLDLRSRFAFPLDKLGETVHALRTRLDGAPEAAVLSTCNRTEIYCAAPDDALAPTMQWLAQAGGVAPETLTHHVYSLQSEQAARHAFRVASGLDSMVLGEPQILGQMKDAVRVAQECGTLGATLNQMFQRSFAVAKEVRTATDIGAQSVSMAAAAVRLASNLFEDLSQIRVLLIGAGDMISLTATHFAARKPKQMVVANRTASRGQRLAAELGGESMSLAELPLRLHEFDAVISCTASLLPIVGLGAVERALKKRRRKPIFMVDLAVPRDIEPEVAELQDVYLYTVDDLGHVVQHAKDSRQAAVVQAEAIVDNGVRQFMHWLQQRQSVPLIQRLQSQAQQWQDAELQRARRRLAKGDNPDEVLQAMARGLSQKMLHPVVKRLQTPEHHDQAAQAIGVLFGHTLSANDATAPLPPAEHD